MCHNFYLVKDKVLLLPTSHRRRILIIADPLDNQRGGVHIVLRELLRELHEINNPAFEYILLRGHDDGQYPNFRTITLKQYKIVGYASLRLFFRIPFVARREQCDAVFEPAHFGPFNLPRRIKRVTFIHDMTPILYPHYHTFNGWFLQRLFLRRILRMTDLILTNSENSKKDIINYDARFTDKTVVNYLGLRTLEHTDIPADDDSPYFFSLGTLEPRKNMITLIRAFEQVCQHEARVKLLIAGASGWKFDETQELLTVSSIKDRIVLLDYISDDEIAGYMRGCAAFVYPSIYEGFGLPVLEALSQRAICIVGNNSCMPEVFQDKALYFDTLDMTDLATTMQYSLTEGAAIKQRLHKGLDNFLDGYSWKKHADRFEVSLAKLIDE